MKKYKVEFTIECNEGTSPEKVKKHIKDAVEHWGDPYFYSGHVIIPYKSVKNLKLKKEN